MTRRTTALAASAATALATILALTSLPAHAADPDPNTPYAYVASAGGTYVNVLGNTASSDLTAESDINGATYPAESSNTTAGAHVGTLLNVGAISTETTATKVDTTVTATSTAETANVSLLNGLIKVSAVKTDTHATRTGTVLSGDSNSQLLGVTIKGKKIPANVNNNFGVKISGIASVILNEKQVDVVGGKITVTGSALKVTLLKKYEGSPIGTTITLNPTQAVLAPNEPSNGSLALGGYARGTYATITAGNTVTAVTGPTAYVATPPGGTFGYDVVNSTAAIKVPFILKTGVVQSTANGVTSPTAADVTHTNKVVGVDLLNGLIKAQAVKVIARSQRLADGSRIQTPSTEIAGLVINGKKIGTLNVSPNTTITVPGVVKVVINEQALDARANTVTGLHVTLLRPRSGLKVGAELYVGIAGSIVF